ncbi:hypothetical protein [Allokutzneria oryzae]|uniref:Uncharacterized protein n=1 Tax=Allokutzneria oryzae TaxID=1378989 RepID=A0ABV5ZS02_9PSEU
MTALFTAALVEPLRGMYQRWQRRLETPATATLVQRAVDGRSLAGLAPP